VFEASSPVTLFDYFRIPYRCVRCADDDAAGAERVRMPGRTPMILWPSESLLSREARASMYSVRSIPIFGRVLSEREMQALVGRTSGSWERADTVWDARGAAVSAVWRREDGGTILPFDPNEILSNFWTERHVDLGSSRAARVRSVARRSYYRVRPVIPRSLQLRARRSFSRVQERSRFPRWPVETAVDDLFRFLFGFVLELADRTVPYIDVWPRDWTWALVLTHDVERKDGYENIHRLLDIEVEHGYRSAWNFVPRNGYVLERKLIDRLRSEGFEVGVHGLFHDGRDVLTRTLPRRLPEIRSYAEQWGAVGFRSPATIRSPRLMPLLGFDYDSSFSDTAPFEPQAGGCCTWLPYMLENMVELPITLVQDHTLFELLQHRNEELWVEKAKLLRERGGMALMLTHPDYVGNPHLVASYRGFLEEFASDSTAWKALPCEVSAWWRRRGDSTIQEADGEWSIAGPAAGEARLASLSAEHVHV
jgi:hypothetical protein